jgi:NAD(P)-dependent dehydrogenase (short-subunit alcohol dehydrogenase family)
MNRLEGKVCIVTGGAPGIGRACVERRADEGDASKPDDIAWGESRFMTGAQLVVDGGYTAR